jgi:serine protease Do
MSMMHTLLTALVLSFAPAGDQPPPPTLPTGPLRVAGRDVNLRQTPVVDAVRRSRDAVVNIHSERTAQGPVPAEELFALAPSQNRINGMGTGVVIDPRGYIITNQHVVDEVGLLRVRLADGGAFPARVLARDAESDLALLKIDAGRPLPTIALGSSGDLMVGETVIAIGNAYGYEHTVSVGVISAVGRDVTLNKDLSYKALIQTDAAINPGNSGGPLLNIYGELIGVNVAIRAGAQNIGFAIPVDAMVRVAAAMMANQPRGRGVSLGLAVRDDTRRDEGGPQRLAVVEKTEPDGPAAKAGLRRGDVLLKVGDAAVASSLDLERALLDHAPGDKMTVVVRRGEAEEKAEVTLTGRSAPVGGDVVWRRLGLRLQAAVPEAVTRANPQLHGGLTVLEVRPDSAASKAGIQRGDVLVGLHQWEMLSLDNVLFVLNHHDLDSFNPLRFYILRGGQVHRGNLPAAD